MLAANRPRLVILTAGSVSIAMASAAVALAASTSLAAVRQTIDAGWRGSFDILVRTPEAQTIRLPDGTLIVPANYAAALGGGITRVQWNVIQQIPGVEVAAPVASLGWVKSDDVAVSVEFPPESTGSLVRVSVTTTVSGKPATNAVAYYASPSGDGSPPFDLGLIGVTAGDVTRLDVGLLPPAWGGVVGIDPEAEDRLIGLASFVDGDYLARGTHSAFDEVFGVTAIGVPLLTTTSAPLDGQLSIVVDRLPPSTATAVETAVGDRVREAQRTGVFPDQAELMAIADAAIGNQAGAVVAQQSAPLGQFLSPFSTQPVLLDTAGHLAPATAGSRNAANRNAILVPRSADYRVLPNGHLALDASGTWQSEIEPRLAAIQPENFSGNAATFGGDDVVFRPLSVTKPQPFVVQRLGQYRLHDLTRAFADAANYVPLGAYADAPRRLIDNDGTSKVMPISLNPGGINPLPPLALTNLEAVEALRGPRFIDAVRVRVAGIEDYSPGSIERIEDVAAAIASRTGLHVDVVAGSSPVDVQVEVPHVGTIIERWTTLGEAARIESAASGISGLLLWFTLAIVAIYLLLFALTLSVDQSAEMRTLELIGWTRSLRVGLVSAQALLIGVGSAVGSVVVTAGVATVMGVQVALGLLASVFAAVIAVHVVSVAIVGALASRVGGMRDAGNRSKGPRQSVGRRGFVWLAFANAFESPWRGVGLAISLGLAAAVAGFVAIAAIGFGTHVHGTVFGQLISFRVGPYHFLAAVAATFAAGAIAVDSALLSASRRMPLIGLLLATGWQFRHIRRLVVLEASLPAVAGGAIAFVVIVVIGTAFHVGVLSAVLAAAAFAGIIGVGAVAGVPALAIAQAVSPAVTLRAEGATSSVSSLTGRAALVVIGLLMIVSVAGGAGWALAAPPSIPRGALIAQPSATAPSAAENRILADVRALAALPDRLPNSDGLRDAQAYLTQRLEGLGYEVKPVPFAIRALDLADQDGVPVDSEEQLDGILAIALAYDAEGLSAPLINGPITFLADPDAAAAARCPAGIAFIRIPSDAGATTASSFEHRCLDITEATLAVRVDEDATWQRLVGQVARAAFVVEHHLVAVSKDAPAGTPWLIAPLTSHGPGATESASPTAVALEVAASAASSDIPARFAFAVMTDGAAASVLTRYLASGDDAAPIVTLGAMGGPVPPAVGTTAIAATTSLDSVRAGLLSTVAIDDTSSGWLDEVATPKLVGTSSTLRDAVAHAFGVAASSELGLNGYLLAVGLDAAYVGEPLMSSNGVTSIAGTPADKPDAVNARVLSQFATNLVQVLDTLKSGANA